MKALAQAPYYIVNDQLVPAAEAVVSVHDRGFRFGDGVFETIAVPNGVPYQFEWHIGRLERGLNAIKINYNSAGLRDHARQLLKKNAVQDGILRIQITRGIGSKGYLPDPGHAQAGATLVMETAPLPPLPKEPITLWQSSYAKISPRALPVYTKLCQGLNSTLARMEAAEHNCAEALLLNERGQICETGSGNIFWYKGGTLYTPALSCGLLEGSTRSALMRLASVREVEAGIEVLKDAEAVFMTNSVWPAVAVKLLRPLDIGWHSGAITQKFYNLLLEDRKNYGQTHRKDWS